MKPIPPEIAARWAPMWGQDAHRERPWWRLSSVDARSAAGAFVVWTRCDGSIASAKWHRPGAFLGSPEQARAALFMAAVDAIGDALARIDAEHPLPVPSPTPGQVWRSWLVSGSEMMVSEVILAASGAPTCAIVAGETMMFPQEWPPPSAILVAGPTPYGRDVPWSPVEGK